MPASDPARDDDALAHRPSLDRDVVSLYSRLTRTLEDICAGDGGCGRDALARRLAALRQSGNNAVGTTAAAAVSRCFRRLNLLSPGEDADTAIRAFVDRTAAAVNRPGHQVSALLGLFCAGDDALSLRPVCGSVPACHQCQLTRDCEYYNKPRKPEMAALTPAQRFWSGNDAGVSDAELLGVLLFGERGTGAEEVVNTLLSRYGRLRAVFRAEAGEFLGIRDMQRPQALRLAAVAALHRRLLCERRDGVLRISTSRDIYDRYVAELRDYRVEAAVLLLLDSQNNVMGDKWFCGESPGVAMIGVKDLLRPAVRDFASAVALVHNHPSGNPEPSLGDIDYTRRVRMACDVLGLGFVDHVIVGETAYYSFADSGMLRG